MTCSSQVVCENFQFDCRFINKEIMLLFFVMSFVSQFVERPNRNSIIICFGMSKSLCECSFFSELSFYQ